MRTRKDFAGALKDLGLVNYAVEVGVAEGYFSFDLLDRILGLTCWQIDPWKILDVPGYSVHGDNDQEARYQRILTRARDYRKRAIPMRMTSAQAAPHFSDDFLDFAYIDANHTLAAATEDVALWWPKVRRHGILAGHDYLDGVIESGDYGVKTAVDTFAATHGLKVNVTQETDYPSWWIQKP